MEIIGFMILGVCALLMVYIIFCTENEAVHLICILVFVIAFLAIATNEIKAPDEKQVMLSKHMSVGSTEGDKNR